MPGYVRYGNPWVDSGPPDIAASFLTALENWIMGVDQPTPVTVTGSVSGSASLYQYLTGTVKVLTINWNNYKSSGAQSLLLPVPFTQNGLVQVCESQGQTLEFLSSGTPVTISVQNTINAGSGGAQLPSTTILSWSFGQIRAGFDTVRLTFTSTAASGYARIEGI
jgi:hypothetical protein